MNDASDFEIVFVDPNEAVCEQLALCFRDYERTSVVCDVFESLERFDCMVSAANSFGLMDGGVDLAITRYFGLELMDRVQQRIIRKYRGEQPVGTCEIVPTGHSEHPYIAHAPTMRVPMPIATTDNVYSAMWAMLLAVWRHNQEHGNEIAVVACPGLGTLTGRVSPQSAARQMKLAYYNFLNPPPEINWPFATLRQNAIGLGGDKGA